MMAEEPNKVRKTINYTLTRIFFQIISPNDKEIITDEFMDWEERDSSSISFFKHCVAGMSRKQFV